MSFWSKSGCSKSNQDTWTPKISSSCSLNTQIALKFVWSVLHLAMIVNSSSFIHELRWRWRLTDVYERTQAAKRWVCSLSVRKSIIDQLPWWWPVLHSSTHNQSYCAERTKLCWAVAGVARVSRKLHLAETSWIETRLWNRYVFFPSFCFWWVFALYAAGSIRTNRT